MKFPFLSKDGFKRNLTNPPMTSQERDEVLERIANAKADRLSQKCAYPGCRLGLHIGNVHDCAPRPGEEGYDDGMGYRGANPHENHTHVEVDQDMLAAALLDGEVRVGDLDFSKVNADARITTDKIDANRQLRVEIPNPGASTGAPLPAWSIGAGQVFVDQDNTFHLELHNGLEEGAVGWETQQRILYIFERCLKLQQEKAQNYGDAYRQQGWMGNLARIMSKTTRLKNMLWKDFDTENAEESVVDTLYDLINLAALMVINRDDRNRWGS